MIKMSVEEIMRRRDEGTLKPGIYEDLTHREYHQGLTGFYSNSGLKPYIRCAADALLPRKDTDSMLQGRALHCILLDGEEVFAREWVVEPHPKGISRNSDQWRRHIGKFYVDNLGKDFITPEMHENVRAMVKSVQAHPSAQMILSRSLKEQTFLWMEKLPNRDVWVWMKARLDGVTSSSHRLIADLKQAKDATNEGFSRQTRQLHYDMQMYVYSRAVNAVFGEPDTFGEQDAAAYWDFTYIAVEPAHPHYCEVWAMDPRWLYTGSDKFWQALPRAVHALETREYPAYANKGIGTIITPNYLLPEEIR